MYMYIRAMHELVQNLTCVCAESHMDMWKIARLLLQNASHHIRFASIRFMSFLSLLFVSFKFVSHAKFCSSLQVEHTDYLFRQNLFATRFGPYRTFRLFLESSASATWTFWNSLPGVRHLPTIRNSFSRFFSSVVTMLKLIFYFSRSSGPLINKK